MIVICSNCTTRLQLDEAKLPARSFSIRCPKCQNIINGQSPAGPADQSALAGGTSPALESGRYKPPTAAPAFKLDASAEETVAEPRANPHTADANDLARLLAEFLQHGVPGAASAAGGAARPGWERKRALVCTQADKRETIARQLAESKYEVFVAEDTSQAIESMREGKMDVVILEAEFDPIEQGAAFVTREVNALRPAQRRRLLLVQLTPKARTLDSHAAFVSNVNLVVNTAELELLPHALERATRDFKELYRDLNAALNVASF